MNLKQSEPLPKFTESPAESLTSLSPSRWQTKTSQLSEVLSPVYTAKVTFENPNKNIVLINGSSLNYPKIDKGRNFEVRQIIDIERPATINRFIQSLPKRFDNDLDFWREYIDVMNKTFCQSFGVRHSRITFSQISDDQCTRFHSDNVSVRLFQTLKGPGTEYVLNDNVDREIIAKAGRPCNSKIVIDASKIKHANINDILLMRGDKWLREKGLVHRSPPIEELKIKRLYLCIDALT